MTTKALGPRLVAGVTMFIVTALSLVMLLYVGFGEGRRTYEQIHIEKVTAQGRLVQDAIERYLRDDLPLKQFAGFNTLVAPIVETEDFDGMAVYDAAGNRVFIVLDKSNPKLPDPSPAITRLQETVEVAVGDTHYQVILPLRTRFETVGSAPSGDHDARCWLSPP